MKIISMYGNIECLCVCIIFFAFAHGVMGHLKNLGEVTNHTRMLEDIESRIVGGKAVNLTNNPHSVLILNKGGTCGGVILSSKLVLTAAHCFDLNKNLADMRVFSNMQYLFDVKSVIHKVCDIELHEKYNTGMKFSYDIAMIMIQDSFTFTKTVQRASLIATDQWMNESERDFKVAGWGETSYGGPLSNGIMMTNLRFISRERCNKMNNIVITNEMFCLYGDGERDTCRGDSGGGVMWKGTVVGIVSFGIGCAKKGSPGVYTNINKFHPWISTTSRDMYKKFCLFHENSVLK